MEEYTNIFRIGEIAFSVIFIAFAIAWLIRGAINKKVNKRLILIFILLIVVGLFMLDSVVYFGKRFV